MSQALPPDHLARVTAHFEAEAAWWSDLYEDDSLPGLVFSRRRDVVLEWIDGLALPAGVRALEVGCGSGVLAVELARRRLKVDAIDVSPALVDATRRRADAAGSADRLTVQLGDVARLEFADGTFRLVVAVAVIPWVASAPAALDEIARVLAPGGVAVVSAVNRARIDVMLDPRRNVRLLPLRRRVAAWLASEGLRAWREYPMQYHGRAEFDRLLRSSGLEPVKSTTVGFGDFSFLGWRLPERLARMLQLRLQSLADQDVPLLRHGGANYIVLVRSPSGAGSTDQASRSATRLQAT
ncbi:MAG: methyltransferase domain-containing protein [Nocardioidaceae bacterium]|nr:methyltransferase domain-containing protein [Nocardioidaceae bacterium]